METHLEDDPRRKAHAVPRIKMSRVVHGVLRKENQGRDRGPHSRRESPLGVRHRACDEIHATFVERVVHSAALGSRRHGQDGPEEPVITKFERVSPGGLVHTVEDCPNGLLGEARIKGIDVIHVVLHKPSRIFLRRESTILWIRESVPIAGYRKKLCKG